MDGWMGKVRPALIVLRFAVSSGNQGSTERWFGNAVPPPLPFSNSLPSSSSCLVEEERPETQPIHSITIHLPHSIILTRKDNLHCVDVRFVVVILSRNRRESASYFIRIKVIREWPLNLERISALKARRNQIIHSIFSPKKSTPLFKHKFNKLE